jgi:hypothetical protein
VAVAGEREQVAAGSAADVEDLQRTAAGDERFEERETNLAGAAIPPLMLLDGRDLVNLVFGQNVAV